MRRVCVSVLLGLLASNAFGQMAPDIAKGTPAEQVIRIYGWPKGKSVADGRESWLYDRFQVMFQQGKVVSVSYIATTTLERSKLSGPTNPGARDPRTLKNTPGPRAIQTPSPVRSSASPSVPSPRPARHAPASDFLVSPAKSEQRSPPSSSGPSTIWIVSGFSTAAVLMGLIILAINRREAAKKLSDGLLEEKRPEPFRKRKTWEEEIAEKLRDANGSKPAPAAKAPLTPGDRVDTSLAAARRIPAPPMIVSELTLELLRKLEWKRFEQIVALYYGETGITAKCTCIGPDGGVDVKLHRNGEERPYCYIQCKAWGSEKVKLTAMREFLGVMAADKISEGIFITTSDFRPDARAFAEANGIAAITANDFIRAFATLAVPSRSRIVCEVTSGDYTTPSCPRCDTKMVWKPTPAFWACPKYPRCRSKPIYPRSD